MKVPTFHVVIYTKYPEPVTNYRVTVPRPKNINMIFESKSWVGLFKLIESIYPGLKYELPDEIDTITY